MEDDDEYTAMKREALKTLLIVFLTLNLTIIVTSLLIYRATNRLPLQIALSGMIVAVFIPFWNRSRRR